MLAVFALITGAVSLIRPPGGAKLGLTVAPSLCYKSSNLWRPSP
jgi:hypothetical protein